MTYQLHTRNVLDPSVRIYTFIIVINDALARRCRTYISAVLNCQTAELEGRRRVGAGDGSGTLSTCGGEGLKLGSSLTEARPR